MSLESAMFMFILCLGNCTDSCQYNGQTYCGHIPCPLPPCPVTPVTSPGDCCPHCPDKHCTNTCKHNGQIFCGHIPCPLPPCKVPTVTSPGDCCAHCPEDSGIAHVQRIFCSASCFTGETFHCHQPPCPMAPCVDPVKPRDQCCETCPTGANCLINGKVYPAFKETVDGDLTCTCKSPGKHGHGECVPKSQLK